MIKRDDTKQTLDALRRHKRRHINRTLRLLNKLYIQANKEDASPRLVSEVLSAHIEVLPFILPKLQAVAMAELQEDGTLTPATYASIVAFMSQQRQLPVPEQPLLEEPHAED